MTTIQNVATLRNQLWDTHPLIMANAHISTIPLLKTYKRIKRCARRARSSIAFWAHPLTGKSFAIEVIVNLLRRDYPGCAVLSYEATSKSKNRTPASFKEQVWVPTSMSGFLNSILDALDYEPKRQRLNSEKKQQLKSALYAVSVASRRLFFIIDEAQELIEAEFCWLKEIVNFLSKKNICVTVILFGQKELKDRRTLLESEGRSDLGVRFIKKLMEFEGIRTCEELEAFLRECDVNSQFPDDSGLTYTQFLWPNAFEAGFRLASCAKDLWTALTEEAPLTTSNKWIKMEWIAQAIADFADLTKSKDGAHFTSSLELWRRALRQADYQAKPLVS